MNGRARPTARHSIASEHSFTVGDVVWVPFPFVEAPRLRDRPALVIALRRPTANVELLWVLMITSAKNRGWRGDISLEHCLAECGLEVPCVVRTAKIATADMRRARKSGMVPADVLVHVRAAIGQEAG